MFKSLIIGGATGVLGFDPALPAKQVDPKGEQALRFDFLKDLFRNISLQ